MEKTRDTEINKPISVQATKPVKKISDLLEIVELAINKMASRWIKNGGTAIPEFILSKFPYVQAMTLVMLWVEGAFKLEKYPPMQPKLIYLLTGLCFASGTMMSLKIRPRYAALLYSGILIYLTFNAYTNKQFNYSKHDQNRIGSRHLGCLGIYLLYAYIKGNRELKLIQRIGEMCIAASLLASAYLINESYEDRRAVTELVPGGTYARYFLTVMLVCGGLCFVSGYFLRDISMTMAFCVMLLTVLVDVKFEYWTYRGFSYWNQARLVADDITLMTGYFMFMSYYEHLAVEEKELNESDDESSDDTNKKSH